jgi:hypothetical protein
MLRTIAVSLIACGVVVAGGVSAHAKSFNSSRLHGRMTPGSGLVTISADLPSACTANSAPTPVEYAYGDASGGPGPSLVEGYIRFYNQLDVTEAYEWPQVIPAALEPLLHNVNFNWPTARDIAAIGYDLGTTYYQNLRSAACEAQIAGMALPRQGDRAATPEPATWVMLILGVAMVGVAARRRSPGAAVTG